MMDDLRLAAVAARVVAWHNRHPLARRIAAAHVHAVGYVGLPFVGAAGTAAAAGVAAPASVARAPQAPAAASDDTEMVDLVALEAGAGEAGSLRERALARARQQATADGGAMAPAGSASPAAPATDAVLPALATLQPDFSEDFIDPLHPREVARFAARAGQVLARAPDDGPVREVPADGAHLGRLPARVYLLTAVIETGTRKSRVLLGTGLTAPVLGRRILDTPRVAALAGLAGVVVGVPAWLLQPADAPPPAPQAAAPALNSPASASASAADGALAAAPAPAPTASDAVRVADLGVKAPASAAITGEALPAVRGPAVQVGGALSIRPVISDEAKARARQAREALLAGRPAAASPAHDGAPPAESASAPAEARVPAPAASPSLSPAPAPAPASALAQKQPLPAPAAALPAPGSAAFALSTRPLRTRAEAEQVQVAMRSLLRTVGAAEVKVDVLPQGDDWRVVALPFPQRAAADKARALLVSRGMRVEVIDF